MVATASRTVALASGSSKAIRIGRSLSTVAAEGTSRPKSRAHLTREGLREFWRPALIIKPKDFGAGSIDLLSSLDPVPPRLKNDVLGAALSETCLFFSTGSSLRSFAILSALEAEGIQTKGVVAAPAEAGVYVDFLSNEDLQRVLRLTDFRFKSKRTSRELEYPSEPPRPDIFAAAAASRAASLPAPSPIPTPSPTPTTSPASKTSPTSRVPSKRTYSNKGPPLHLKPSPSHSTTPAKSPPVARPSFKDEKAAVPSPSAKAKVEKVEQKLKDDEKEKKSRPIDPIESHSVSPDRLRTLFKETAGVGVGKVYKGKELFEGEDGVLFARVEIPGFPHRVYISTSLADDTTP